MAHKESELLSLNEKYKLDKYEFSIKTQEIPQTQLMDVIAKATGPAGKMGAKTIQIPSNTEIEGWCVEANDKTVDVFIKTKSAPYEPLNIGNCEPPPVKTTQRVTYEVYGAPQVIDAPEDGTLVSAAWRNNKGYTLYVLGATTKPGIYPFSITHAGKTVYYGHKVGMATRAANIDPILYTRDINAWAETAWMAIYGKDDPDEEKDQLVGRFAIDIRLAGGTAGNGGELPGPDGQPWQDVDDGQPTLWPGDEGYPDPEDPDYPGDGMPYYPPAKTLYVTINGALSGRHNDPLNDTSYSYIPADQIAQTQYGSGGIGGNGGGGGAGASTIIVRKFATKKADSKTFVLKPKRHGYGSGGGKGGKGGDGCILIYY